MSRIDNIHTGFRSAIQRMSELKRIQVYKDPIDQDLQIAAVMKKLDGGKAILFPSFDQVIPGFKICNSSYSAFLSP